jgi:ABC-type multidrug transport system ATPase subunit
MNESHNGQQLLSAEHIVKKYGRKTVVQDLSMYVNRGEVILLLGQNGAGKTTTINCILGSCKYDGNVRICNEQSYSLYAKRNIGYVPESPSPYDYLTVMEHLEFIAAAYKLLDWRDRADSLLSTFHMTNERNKLGVNLSKGMKQKLNICCALLIQPLLLIIDEPFVGLDPQAIAALKRMILFKKTEGCGILLSTHMIDMVDDLWDRAYILSDGNLVATPIHDGTMKRGSLEKMFLDVTSCES